jgi:hypothetical protein
MFRRDAPFFMAFEVLELDGEDLRERPRVAAISRASSRKWAHGTYQLGLATSWLKIKNPHYSQMEGRRELFEARRQAKVTGPRGAVPMLRLA